ncbi:hypothetical protein MML48_1g07154 [Holotrichia oblita]|uniref:Uncharacterized protein n=1 Tax=Holotrichia oblita TaxID=644536 RepID=A0ACB9TT72_HOLOL|nr:hypothetical protein MML48_1g07154 [Holotrichia oblita]
MPLVSDNPFDLPANTMEEFTVIDAGCNNESDRLRLVSVLYLCGGDCLRDAVHMIMKELLTKELCLQFSLKGKLSTQAFDKTNVFQAIIVAVRQRFDTATDHDINKTIARWLATARDRDGGRAERKLKKDIVGHASLTSATDKNLDS